MTLASVTHKHHILYPGCRFKHCFINTKAAARIILCENVAHNYFQSVDGSEAQWNAAWGCCRSFQEPNYVLTSTKCLPEDQHEGQNATFGQFRTKKWTPKTKSDGEPTFDFKPLCQRLPLKHQIVQWKDVTVEWKRWADPGNVIMRAETHTCPNIKAGIKVVWQTLSGCLTRACVNASLSHCWREGRWRPGGHLGGHELLNLHETSRVALSLRHHLHTQRHFLSLCESSQVTFNYFSLMLLSLSCMYVIFSILLRYY